MVSGAPESIENLVIVGSGPAGYTAAIYAARANLQPILVTGFQRGGIPGGQLMTTTHVENFPGFPDGVLGPDLMDLMKAQAVRWGTHLLEADADSIDLSQRPFQIQVEGETIRAHAVVIATGASANRLGLPSEEKFWSSKISPLRAIPSGSHWHPLQSQRHGPEWFPLQLESEMGAGLGQWNRRRPQANGCPSEPLEPSSNPSSLVRALHREIQESSRRGSWS